MSGRTVVIADVKALDSKVSVSLDKTLPEGIYIYSIKDNNGAILSKGKIVSAL
jgi:hypothetical protein